MKTKHKIIFSDAKEALSKMKSESLDLMITSPPYPMIEMWDEIFSKQNPEVKRALENKGGRLAFELMHKELDKVWKEVYRTLKEGGIACINIGDATRKVNGDFELYPSHSRILNHCTDIGFQVLPEILWRKQTNSPNKFMGSGMLPPSAYITLEHEFILVLRKGSKKEFENLEDQKLRRESAFFWEERNIWFSDVWTDIKGTMQKLKNGELRDRSAAYPFELAYRLINMFSIKGDLVLDPFLGTGTTTLAAIASQRNSIGIEIDKSFKPVILSKVIDNNGNEINNYIQNRVLKHSEFISMRKKEGKMPAYINKNLGLPVITRQEISITFEYLKEIKLVGEGVFEVSYSQKISPNKNTLQNYIMAA